MQAIVSVLHIAAPLLLLTLGALVSEYGGRLAMFMEYAINLGAFFCYAFTLASGSPILGTILSLLTVLVTILLLERAAAKLKANMFLISLAMNLLFAALATFFSSQFFNTRGVLYSADFKFNPALARLTTSSVCYAASILIMAFLMFTKRGLRMRVTGTNPDLLFSQGTNPDIYRCISWLFAGGAAALAGSSLALRLSSYVPGMSGGRGWTALAAVYLGRKSPLLAGAAVLFFAVTEFASTNIQNVSLFAGTPPSLLLALPYLAALLLILITPKKK